MRQFWGRLSMRSVGVGLYAFASRDGVDHLIEDPIFNNYLGEDREIDLLVGIDAVTSRGTLERLLELERENGKFRPKIFWNYSNGLFHPKISYFTYEDGRQTLIVGSGNLTPGGLRNNFEGYTIASVDRTEELDISALEEFLTRHSSDIRSIDEEALERAARNVGPPINNLRRKNGIIVSKDRRKPGAPTRGVVETEFGRILIARVPAAGGRWAQVHFNVDVVREFFKITNHQIHRVCLTHVEPNGVRGEIEVRPCVFSDTNRNHKIEIRAARGKQYPDDGLPLLIFRERQLRAFDYMLIMPGESGYSSLMELTERLPSVGKGFRRIITDMDVLAGTWPESPLIASGEAGAQEI